MDLVPHYLRYEDPKLLMKVNTARLLGYKAVVTAVGPFRIDVVILAPDGFILSLRVLTLTVWDNNDMNEVNYRAMLSDVVQRHMERVYGVASGYERALWGEL